MRAMDIANDALDSVLGDFKIALKISIPVMLLNLVVSAIFGFDFWQALFSGDGRGAQAIMDAPYGAIKIIIIPLLFVLLSMYWVTVAWHRFVILDEQPSGMFPKLHLGRIWAYIWRLLVLTIVIAFVIALPLALLSSILGGGGKINIANYSEALARGPVAVVFNLIGTILFAYVFLRYSPFLVAAAIGKPIAAASGREATYWAKKDIFLLAVGYAVMSLVYTLIGGGLSTGLWQIDLAIILALQWVAFMFTISLLTTLYQKSVAYYSESGQEDRILT
ncbi:MAG: hypothetical protein L3J30_10190 [Marinosulfonomonas sp.]|nr:hypothetical protein [Marinosulfonomonas sp.]